MGSDSKLKRGVAVDLSVNYLCLNQLVGFCGVLELAEELLRYFCRVDDDLVPAMLVFKQVL